MQKQITRIAARRKFIFLTSKKINASPLGNHHYNKLFVYFLYEKLTALPYLIDYVHQQAILLFRNEFLKQPRG